MPDPAQKTVTVEAQPGRTVPLHRDDHAAGPDPFFLEPGKRCEVRWTTGIRRRIRAGDLKVVTEVQKFDESKTGTTPIGPEIATAPIAAPAAAPTK